MNEVGNWYKNMSYKDAKIIIKTNINNMARSFIAVGYYLKEIRDRELYREDGYQNIWEFAEAEYGLQRTTATRWMAINDRFSQGGNSPVLNDQYKDFSKSQLQEMLYLTDVQAEDVTPDMTVKQIREIRKPEPKEVYTDAEKKEIMLQAFECQEVRDIIPALNQRIYELHENNCSAVIEVVVPALPISQGDLTVEDAGGIRITVGDRFAVWPYYPFMKMYMDLGFYQRPELTTDVEEKCATSHTESERSEKAQARMCSRYKGYACGIDEIVKKHFTKGGYITDCACCCDMCRKKRKCQYICEAVAKERIRQQPEDEQIPGQMSIEDYPDLMPEQGEPETCATSHTGVKQTKIESTAQACESDVLETVSERPEIESKEPEIESGIGEADKKKQSSFGKAMQSQARMCLSNLGVEIGAKAWKAALATANHMQHYLKKVIEAESDLEQPEPACAEPRFAVPFLRDILWDREQELKQMEECNASPDGRLPERMMQERRAMVAGLRLLLEQVEAQEESEEDES